MREARRGARPHSTPCVVALLVLASAREASAQPLNIPKLLPPTFDGGCLEYEFALSTTFLSAEGVTVTVFLQHYGVNLYACFTNLRRYQTSADAFAAVFFDPNNSRNTSPQADDSYLQTRLSDGVTAGYHGLPPFGWAAGPSNWSATVAGSFNATTAEFRIGLDIAGGQCGAVLNFALGHMRARAPGDDYLFPLNAVSTRPDTWRTAVLSQATCPTNTPTRSATPSRTPSITSSPSPTPTSSVTRTPTSAPTITITATRTPTNTPTASPTRTPSPLVPLVHGVFGLRLRGRRDRDRDPPQRGSSRGRRQRRWRCDSIWHQKADRIQGPHLGVLPCGH